MHACGVKPKWAHTGMPDRQEQHGLGRPAAAFELDHVGTGLHQGHAGTQGLFAFSW